jgi:hypothetical protein
MNPTSPQANLHHTRTQYDYTDEELWREQQRDRAEAEYFASTEPITHENTLTTHVNFNNPNPF